MSRLIRVALYEKQAHKKSRASEIKDLTWDELCQMLSVCEPAPCGEQCSGPSCHAKYGRGWSPVRFVNDEIPIRNKTQVAAVTCAVFDVDAWDVSNWAAKLEDMELALKGEEYCMHSTHSSTPSLPKFRLVMPISRDSTQEEWARWWPWAVSKFKIPTIAGSLAAAARMYFLPSSGRPDQFMFFRQ